MQTTKQYSLVAKLCTAEEKPTLEHTHGGAHRQGVKVLDLDFSHLEGGTDHEQTRRTSNTTIKSTAAVPPGQNRKSVTFTVSACVSRVILNTSPCSDWTSMKNIAYRRLSQVRSETRHTHEHLYREVCM